MRSHLEAYGSGYEQLCPLLQRSASRGGMLLLPPAALIPRLRASKHHLNAKSKYTTGRASQYLGNRLLRPQPFVKHNVHLNSTSGRASLHHPSRKNHRRSAGSSPSAPLPPTPPHGEMCFVADWEIRRSVGLGGALVTLWQQGETPGYYIAIHPGFSLSRNLPEHPLSTPTSNSGPPCVYGSPCSSCLTCSNGCSCSSAGWGDHV